MIAKGIPAKIGFTYTAENDPNHLLGRQSGYASKISFQDSGQPTVSDFLSESSSSTDGGAALECYTNAGDAAKRFAYLQNFSGSALGDGYDYLAGQCVLRVSSNLTPTEAQQYKQTLEAVSSHQ